MTLTTHTNGTTETFAPQWAEQCLEAKKRSYARLRRSHGRSKTIGEELSALNAEILRYSVGAQ